MDVFAIRHKPTGEWMPCRMFRSTSRGWSHWIPGPAPEGWGGCDGFDKNPRLFFSLRGAQNALSAWLQGVHKRATGGGTSGWDWDEPYDETSIDVPPIERKREDMEIVPMWLVER